MEISRIARITGVAGLFAAAGTLFWPVGGAAQSYPNRPITMLYPFGASAIDSYTRAIAAQVSKAVGQPVPVENRPGAGGRVAMTAIVNAPGDGYLLSMATTSMLIFQPLTSATFKIEPGKDYLPIGQVYSLKFGWYANSALPFRDVKGLIAYAKSNPGKLNSGSTGIASTGHLALELLNAQAGIQIVHVPFKSEGELTSGTMNQTIHLFLTGAGPKPLVEAGKLQFLASTGNERWRVFPDRPTMREAGLDYVYVGWMGVVAPPGTPRDVVAKLNATINAALKTPEVIKVGEAAGLDAVTDSTPEQFAALIRSDFKTLQPVVARSGIRAD